MVLMLLNAVFRYNDVAFFEHLSKHHQVVKNNIAKLKVFSTDGVQLTKTVLSKQGMV